MILACIAMADLQAANEEVVVEACSALSTCDSRLLELCDRVLNEVLIPAPNLRGGGKRTLWFNGILLLVG